MPEPTTEVIASAPSDSVAPAPTAPSPAVEPKEVSIREALEAQLQPEGSEPKAPEAPEAQAKPGEPKPGEQQQPQTPEQQAAEQTELVRQGRMPRNWKSGLDKWHTLEPVTKDYILRREREFAQGIEMYRNAATIGTTLMNEFSPYQEMLKSLNATPQQAVNYLLGAYARLVTGSPAEKAHFVVQLAQENGVDIGEIVSNGLPQVDPNAEIYRQRYFELSGQLRQKEQQQQNAEQAEVNRQIDAFASDPKHEHFDTVRPHMAALLGNGQAKDLQDAYDQACWAHPQVRASLVNRQLADGSEQRRRAAEAAKAAAVSVTGAPPAPTVTETDDSIRGLLTRHMSGAGARI